MSLLFNLFNLAPDGDAGAGAAGESSSGDGGQEGGKGGNSDAGGEDEKLGNNQLMAALRKHHKAGTLGDIIGKLTGGKSTLLSASEIAALGVDTSKPSKSSGESGSDEGMAAELADLRATNVSNERRNTLLDIREEHGLTRTETAFLSGEGDALHKSAADFMEWKENYKAAVIKAFKITAAKDPDDDDADDDDDGGDALDRTVSGLQARPRPLRDPSNNGNPLTLKEQAHAEARKGINRIRKNKGLAPV